MSCVPKLDPPRTSGVHSISLAKGSLIFANIHSSRCLSASIALALSVSMALIMESRNDIRRGGEESGELHGYFKKIRLFRISLW